MRLDASPGRVLAAAGVRGVAPTRSAAAGGRLERAHGAACMRASASLRALRLARSMRATSSAGMMYSSRSRQANTTKVA